MTIFSKNFGGGMTPLAPSRKFSAYATEPKHLQKQTKHSKIMHIKQPLTYQR